MTTENEWKQLNKSTFQRIYPSGVIGIVRGEGHFVANEIFQNGNWSISPDGMALPRSFSAKVLMDALDKKHDSQPDTMLGGEGYDWTIYVHGKRAAMVRMSSCPDAWRWNACDNVGSGNCSTYDLRAEAEAAARRYVLEGK